MKKLDWMPTYGKLQPMKVKGSELQVGDIILLKYGPQRDRYAIVQRSYLGPSSAQHLHVDDGNEDDSPFFFTTAPEIEFFIWRAE